MERTCIGTVVRSKCGRDKKRVFLIVGVCDDGSGRVLVADGVLHTLSKPKKKNLAHLAVLAAAASEETSFSIDCDSGIAHFIREYEEKYGE